MLVAGKSEGVPAKQVIHLLLIIKSLFKSILAVFPMYLCMEAVEDDTKLKWQSRSVPGINLQHYTHQISESFTLSRVPFNLILLFALYRSLKIQFIGKYIKKYV